MWREIDGMRHQTVGQLKAKYREMFGNESRSNHKQFLVRRIAWRLQANAEGSLSERARFTKASLERLLRNVLYLGKVAHQGEVYAGEQEAIVAQPDWERVQAQLVKGQQGSGVAAGPAQAKKTRPPSAATPPTERVPRITRLLALALKFEELIRFGAVSNYAVLARVGQVSPSRISQMASLLSLAPDIQEDILFLRPAEAKQLRISEPSLRKLTATLLWNQQREQWRNLRRSVRPVAD
jgi:hypothetical protein